MHQHLFYICSKERKNSLLMFVTAFYVLLLDTRVTSYMLEKVSVLFEKKKRKYL